MYCHWILKLDLVAIYIIKNDHDVYCKFVLLAIAEKPCNKIL